MVLPRVDVVVPCYRYGRFVSECARSILEQDGCDVRILIIDDASDDGSADVVRALAKSDPRIEAIVHEKNKGHIATYNEGIEWASADYFLLLSADDLLMPGALRRATSVMERDKSIAFTHGFEIWVRDGEPLPGAPTGGEHDWTVQSGQQFIEQICRLASNIVSTSTVVVRTSAQKAVGGYRPTLPHSGDLEMWLRLATKGAVAITPAAQGIRRLHGSNMSAEYFDDLVQDYRQREAAFASFFATEGLGLPEREQLRRLSRRRVGERAYWSAIARAVSRRPGMGRELMQLAVELNPPSAYIPPVRGLIVHERPLQKIVKTLSLAIGRAPPRFAS